MAVEFADGAAGADDDGADDDDDDFDGFAVVGGAAEPTVVLLPPRSPGWTTATSTATTNTPIAPIRVQPTKRAPPGAFIGRTRQWRERVTGVEPASPAWKAGALPLSYTRR